MTQTWDVLVRHSDLRLPERCACCGGEPTTFVLSEKAKGLYLHVLVIQRSVKLRVPYCEGCAAHVRTYQRSTFTGMLLANVLIFFGSVFAGMALSEMAGPPRWPVLMLCTLGLPAAMVAGHVYLRRALRRRAAARLGNGHANLGPAVWCADFDGQHAVLRCVDLKYAEQIEAVNARPLVHAQGHAS